MACGALHIRGRREDAADAVQETFVSTLIRLNQLRGACGRILVAHNPGIGLFDAGVAAKSPMRPSDEVHPAGFVTSSSVRKSFTGNCFRYNLTAGGFLRKCVSR